MAIFNCFAFLSPFSFACGLFARASLRPGNTRLRLYKNEDVPLSPYEFLTLVNVTSGSGAVYMVTLQANSTDYNYLEACFRLKVNGEDGYQFLSSGTEDFFLSAYYFNSGKFHADNAGCTFLDGKGAMSAYKFFENDPILYTSKVEMVWRCGETQGDTTGCPSTFPPNLSRRKKRSRRFSPLIFFCLFLFTLGFP